MNSNQIQKKREKKREGNRETKMDRVRKIDRERSLDGVKKLREILNLSVPENKILITQGLKCEKKRKARHTHTIKLAKEGWW